MLLKLIACNVFWREACHCLARSPHTVDAEFLELGEHIRPDVLRQAIQARIDQAAGGVKGYDAVLLLYGLCGNAGVGLRARTQTLIIPRAHDCCTILLGDRERFRQHFQENPSMPFSSAGYMERGSYFLRTSEDGQSAVAYGDQFAALVDQYGEDDAKFIWESMHPKAMESVNNKVVFIDVPETGGLGFRERFGEQARAEGKVCIELPGSLDLIRRLVNGEWDAGEFLTVAPGEQTTGVYDWTEIIRSGPGE
ncbi:MAG: DUF1638 domain-containing protein [Planctomycetota bacterium]|nr:DUF1638 domain-containing protein [Planctomycetota bacterium]